MPAAATHCVVLAGGPPFLGCLSGWGLQLGGTQVEPNMAHWGIGLWLICFASCTTEARCDKVFQWSYKWEKNVVWLDAMLLNFWVKKVTVGLNFIFHWTGWWLLPREQTALWDDLPQWNSPARNQHQTLHDVVWGKEKENQCNSEVSIWAIQKPVVSGLYLAWYLYNWISEQTLRVGYAGLLTKDEEQLPNFCASSVFFRTGERTYRACFSFHSSYSEVCILVVLSIHWLRKCKSFDYSGVDYMTCHNKKNLVSNKMEGDRKFWMLKTEKIVLI